MKKKIYFVEKSSDFNFMDLNSDKIAGAEKTLINISNELSQNKHYEIKVFNKTSNEFKSDISTCLGLLPSKGPTIPASSI